MQIATTIKSPMSILDRFSRVKYKLWKKFRFFAFLIEHLTFIENASIGTAAINRYGHFSYSPNFLNGLSDDELMGLTCHEVLHLALKHPERGQGRDLFVGGASLLMWLLTSLSIISASKMDWYCLSVVLFLT